MVFLFSFKLHFQVQIQLLFIADLRHKKASSTTVAKPGRQIVTFLLVCNLGLWITYNFEMQKVTRDERAKLAPNWHDILSG